jgi:4-hydroxy-3-methylbut-2-enyl diphosphate reductase
MAPAVTRGGSSGTYFQRGFDLKSVVRPILAESYRSPTVERLRQLGFTASVGELTLRLAREFGFCYGVDRAVDYAYETRARFPDRRIFLPGEIIHNPEVNARLAERGIRSLPEAGDPQRRYAAVSRDDVVILPAFGVPVAEMQHLRSKGCVLVDTTCGSVLNVWKSVRRYAHDGFTAIIHGKHYHEETRATVSVARAEHDGHYLCVLDRTEAGVVCDFIRGRRSSTELLDRLGHAASPGFDPPRHLARIGLANQTTVLMSESLAIQEMLGQAMRERYGAAQAEERFRKFDTICSATQDRQDAVLRLLEAGRLDLMIVIGGYNSSNTQALARICAERLPTFHISGPDRIAGEGIRHRPVGQREEQTTQGWLPNGAVAVGLTAGASTPNSVVGDVIERVLAVRGLDVEDLRSA